MATEQGVDVVETVTEKKPKKKNNKCEESTMEDKMAEYFSSINPMARRIIEEQYKCKYSNRKVWHKLNQDEKDKLVDEYFIIPQLTEAYEANTGVAEPGPQVFPKLKIEGPKKVVQYTDEGSSNSKAKTLTWKDEFSEPFSWETRSQLEMSLPSPEEDIGANLPVTPKPSDQDFEHYKDSEEENSDEDEQKTETSKGSPDLMPKMSFDFDFDKAGSQQSLQLSLGETSEYDNVSEPYSLSTSKASISAVESSRENLIEELKRKTEERPSSRGTVSTSSSSNSSSARVDKKEKIKHSKQEGYFLLEDNEPETRILKTRSKESLVYDKVNESFESDSIGPLEESGKSTETAKASTLPAGGFEFLTDW
ncbi:uncharacterized protein [Ptychodera flava]|uniref:uncharacterized protein n=1 Tax=Ptychodera flava TaxID=63121 RepID=UPI00396A262E